MGGGGEIIAGCGLSGWLRQNYVLSWLVVDGGGKIMADRGWSHDLVMPVKIFVFISWLFSLKVFIHIQHFLAVVRKKLQTLTIKRRSKVQENNMSCERALNFDQWKTFSENYKPMSLIMACSQISRELLLLATFLRVHSKSKEASYLSCKILILT